MIVRPGQHLGNAAQVRNTVVRAAREQAATELPYHILVGKYRTTTPSWSIIGSAPSLGGKLIAMDHDNCNATVLMGVQGAGKSYTLQLLMEASLMPIPGINDIVLNPCGVYFFYTDEETYEPEALTMRHPNREPAQVDALVQRWRAQPQGVQDLVLLVPPRMLERRRQEYPDVRVEPIIMGIEELAFIDWKCMMGLAGVENDYVYVANNALDKHFDTGATVQIIRDEIAGSRLDATDKNTADIRLTFLERFTRPGVRLSDLVKPGRLILVDLRDPTLSETNAFRLLVVLQRILSHAKLPNGMPCPKVIYTDEFHIFQDDFLLKAMEKNVRMMRHQGASYVFASQDPINIRRPFLQLASVIVCNRMIAPDWLNHIRTCNSAFDNIRIGDLARLESGQGMIWARQASESKLIEAPFRIDFRPAVTQPGGSTITASAAAAGKH